MQARLFLEKKLSEVPHLDYPVQSRVHALRSYPKGFYVKRDDELGFGVSGCKFRKYRTLIPYILKQGAKEVMVVGGAFSNHVLSLTQLLLENGLEPTLFLKGPPPTISQGNFLFLQMLVSPSNMHWVEKDRWAEIDSIVAEYAAQKSGCFILGEGAPLFEAFLGALTLPLDILRNEEESHCTFDQLYMEVGTGYSAAALLLGFAFLEKKCAVHLMHVAEDEGAFLAKLKRLHHLFESWLEQAVPFPRYHSFLPTLAPSFGSTNQALFQFITETARQEGFFLDPIYSAKLFYGVKEQLQRSPHSPENSLLIHSGGALALTGFQNQISKAYNK